MQPSTTRGDSVPSPVAAEPRRGPLPGSLTLGRALRARSVESRVALLDHDKHRLQLLALRMRERRRMVRRVSPYTRGLCPLARRVESRVALLDHDKHRLQVLALRMR